MTRYLISFDDGAMTFPEEETPAVADAAHAVLREAKAAGVYVLAGGLEEVGTVTVVGTDGTVAGGSQEKAYLGGFMILDVPSHEEALAWAARIAAACRCAQEVRAILFDPET